MVTRAVVPGAAFGVALRLAEKRDTRRLTWRSVERQLYIRLHSLERETAQRKLPPPSAHELARP
jgi:hypothetical protein